MYLVIENKGLVPPEAFTLLGASDKRDDSSKIGFFGSGTKYALAWLLRNERAPWIFSGTNQITIDTVTRSFKDKILNVIRVNDIETSITTEMGPNWKEWYVVREFISNAIDEGEMNVFQTDTINPEPGKTRIYLPADKFAEIWNRKHLYFKFWSTPSYQVPRTAPGLDYAAVNFYLPVGKKVSRLFRKGILVSETGAHSVYDYDLDEAEINESRELSSSYYTYYAIGSAILQVKDKEIIKKYIEAGGNGDYFEARLSYNRDVVVSDEWIEVLASMGKIIVPHSTAGFYENKYEGIIVIWDWMYTAMKAKLAEFKVTNNEQVMNEAPETSLDHEKLIKLFARFGIRVKEVKVADILNAKSTILIAGTLYISRSRSFSDESELSVLKVYCNNYFTTSTLIDHLIIST